MGNETSTGFCQGEKGKFVGHFITDWDDDIKILVSNVNSVSSEIKEATASSTLILKHIHPLRQVRSSFSMNKIGMLRLTKHKTNN